MWSSQSSQARANGFRGRTSRSSGSMTSASLELLLGASSASYSVPGFVYFVHVHSVHVFLYVKLCKYVSIYINVNIWIKVYNQQISIYYMDRHGSASWCNTDVSSCSVGLLASLFLEAHYPGSPQSDAPAGKDANESCGSFNAQHLIVARWCNSMRFDGRSLKNLSKDKI